MGPWPSVQHDDERARPVDDGETRPDFAAAIYGGTADEAKVPLDAPPLFVLCAADDNMVNPARSTELFSAWRKAKHPVELHIYSKGGHGFGIGMNGGEVATWPQRPRQDRC